MKPQPKTVSEHFWRLAKASRALADNPNEHPAVRNGHLASAKRYEREARTYERLEKKQRS